MCFEKCGPSLVAEIAVSSSGREPRVAPECAHVFDIKLDLREHGGQAKTARRAEFQGRQSLPKALETGRIPFRAPANSIGSEGAA